MKQLDIDVSPPAFLWYPHFTLANVKVHILHDNIVVDFRAPSFNIF